MVGIVDLKAFNLFSGLDEAELAEISKLCTHRTCNANTEIFTANQIANDLYLLEGPNDSVVIEMKIHEHGPPKVIHTLKKGEAVGWAAVVPPYLRTGSARCLSKANLVCINGKALIQLMEKNNHIGYILMKNLGILLSVRFNNSIITFRHEIRNLMNNAQNRS